MQNEFWFEAMKSVTFEFPRNIQTVTVVYTYLDENGKLQNGCRKYDFTEEEKYGDRR